MESQLITGLRTMVRGRVAAGEPLSKHTSFRLGGIAEVYVRPNGEDDFIRTVGYARVHGIPFFLLGRGSNLLVADGGVEGMVINTGGMGEANWLGNTVRLGAGASLSNVARRAVARNLEGLEFAAGIPGTVGGGLVMNAGAHGGNLSGILNRARILDREGAVRQVDSAQLGLDYRKSAIKDRQWIVLEAELSLVPGDREELQGRMEAYQERRKATQPLGERTAGSIFKNPPGMAAGRLIEEAGGKGLRVGGAEVSSIHANFIVAKGGTSAQDVLQLVAIVRGLVREKSGVLLEPEVEFLGFRL